MPNCGDDLFTCRLIASDIRSVAVWKIIPYCLFWCHLREMNDRSFVDRNKAVEELDYFFFILFVFA
jgi:hypothetical protein